MWNCFWEITDEPTVMPKKQSKQILPILRWVWSHDSWKSFFLFYFFCRLCYEIELEAFGIFPPSPIRDHLINSPHMHCDVAWLWVWWKNSIKQILAWMGSRTGISLASLIPNANFRLILEGRKLLWHLDCTQKHQTFVSRAWSLTQKMMSSKRYETKCRSSWQRRMLALNEFWKKNTGQRYCNTSKFSLMWILHWVWKVGKIWGLLK